MILEKETPEVAASGTVIQQEKNIIPSPLGQLSLIELRKQPLFFLSPSQIINIEPPEGVLLVGDHHIDKGHIVVIGGAPGVGKSRAALALALSGCTQEDWFGLEIHRRFKTMMLQNENSLTRLKDDFARLENIDQINDFFRISLPPCGGILLRDTSFQKALMEALNAFRPDLFILDPWNSITSDDAQKEYKEALDLLIRIVHSVDPDIAIIIIAHPRKPRIGEISSRGKDLANELSGSHILQSRARTIFMMQALTSAPEDVAIRWTCCKNNDAPLGKESFWRYESSGFVSCGESFEPPIAQQRKKITTSALREIFENGNRKMTRTAAINKLKEATDCGQSACYQALSKTGKFAQHLVIENGEIGWQEFEVLSTPLPRCGSGMENHSG